MKTHLCRALSRIAAISLAGSGLVGRQQALASIDNAAEPVEAATHRAHDSLANDFIHTDLSIPERVFSVTPTTRFYMNGIVDTYLKLKESLVMDNEKASDDAAAAMAGAVSRVPLFEFDDNGATAWRQHAELYSSQLKEMQHIGGLANKRSYFAHISEIVYCTIKTFGFANRTLYVDFCPMAFDGKGAYWLSTDEEFENPYMGLGMARCGEIREVVREVWRPLR